MALQQQPIHPLRDGQRTVAGDVQKLLPQTHQLPGLFIIGFPLSFTHQLHGRLLGQNQLGSTLTAQAKADFGTVRQKIAETGMVIADLAQHSLATGKNEIAQIVTVEKGTALPFPKDEMGRVVVGNGLPQTVAQRSGYFLIPLQALRIHIDLPANTA
jgi:hypothetical protein